SVTKIVCPFGCVCQAVRAPGVKCTLLALRRDEPAGTATGSMNTTPVNHSLGPLVVLMPPLVTCIPFFYAHGENDLDLAIRARMVVSSAGIVPFVPEWSRCVPHQPASR